MRLPSASASAALRMASSARSMEEIMAACFPGSLSASFRLCGMAEDRYSGS